MLATRRRRPALETAQIRQGPDLWCRSSGQRRSRGSLTHTLHVQFCSSSQDLARHLQLAHPAPGRAGSAAWREASSLFYPVAGAGLPAAEISGDGRACQGWPDDRTSATASGLNSGDYRRRCCPIRRPFARISRACGVSARPATLSPWCGQLMVAGQDLDLDHTVPRAVDASSVGDRIVYAACDRGRFSQHRT